MWYYNKKEIQSIEDMPDGCIGFIYCITNLDNKKKYIGRKILFTEQKTKISKREQEATNNRRKKFKYVKKESNWKQYTGSCDELNMEIKNFANIRKEILEFCYSKMQLNYLEEKYLFCLGTIESDIFYNGNIGNRYFKEKIK